MNTLNNSEPVIAIDFGNSYTRVSTWKDNNVEFIPNEYGKY
jgi:molecular chaperone DnaK (HSP70)